MARASLQCFDAALDEADTDVLVDSGKDPYRAWALYRLRPNAVRLLYLVRDGRGVMTSMLGAGRKASTSWHDDPGAATAQWVTENRAIEGVLNHVRPEHWMFLRYEDLCRDPEQALAEVCSFADLEPDPSMLDFRSAEHHDVGGNRMRFAKGDRAIRLDEKWRRKATPAHLAAFEQVGGELNRHLGYGP